MMDRFLRLASIVLVAAGLAACDDDTEAPAGETSTVNISVYVEADAVNGLTAGDTPISGASVELVANEGGETRTATTGADGIATFTDVPAGVYTATHTPSPPITNATLTSDVAQTVVAQFEGGTSTAAFIYAFEPGTIAGQFFRDENDNDTFEEGTDVTLAGFQALLFAGTDTTTDTELDAVTTDDTGAFLFEDVAPGDYTILVRPLIGADVADSTIAVTVAAGATSDVLIEFTGGEQVTDIGVARELTIGTTVTVAGIVTSGTEVFNATTAYIQDPTGGIVIDQFGRTDIANLTRGDSVLVTGVVDEFNAEIRLEGGDALEIDVLTQTDVPDPRVVTAAEVNAGDFQGELVELTGTTVDSIQSGFNSTVWISDAAGTDVSVFIDGTTDIDMASIVVGEMYNFTGVNARFNAQFQVKPRSTDDIELTSAPAGTIDVALARVAEVGTTVTVNAVVTAGTGVYNTTAANAQDPTAGIVIDQFGKTTLVPLAEGDSVTVTGTIGLFNDEVRIQGGDAMTITVHGAAVAPPTAESVEAAQVNEGQHQGELVVADSVRIVDVEDGSAVGDNYDVVVEDETGTFIVFIDGTTNIDPAVFTEGSSYAITGVMARFQELREIKPRSSADIAAL